VPGVHVLQQIDPTKLGPSGVCGVDHTHAIAAPATPNAGFSAGVNSDCNLTTIDLLICYTPLARANAGGTTAIETVLVNAVAQANDGHRESGAPVEFRLVHTHETNYTELGTTADLSAFRSTSDGIMDEVHALRNTYGADLMHLVTDGPGQFCGVAYLMTSLSTGFASSAFGVTRRTCIPGRTMTHECGHNLGCHHDIANAGNAIYPYAYGYRTPDNAWRTIMAYAPGTRINRWSSPNVDWQGQAMGVAGSADNVLTLTNTTTTAAAFRPTTTLRWCDLSGGIAGTTGVPVLAGQGTIDQTQPIELRIRDYAPNAVGLLIIGATAINVPIFGGTLVPAIDVTLPLVGTTTELVESCAWLATQNPGFEAWFQAAFLDLGAVQGFAASDAVKVTLP
jgi:Metallo-peptidase family M12